MKIEKKRNIKRRLNFNKVEKKKKVLHWCLSSMLGRKATEICNANKAKYNVPLLKVRAELMLCKADFSISKIKNVCYKTRRSRAISRAFRLSRQTFKEQVQQHFFVGVSRFPYKD